MSWQAWALTILIVVFATIQYSLAWSAIADLLHRPRVRGDSHMFWALVITCVPVLGALAYGAIGPTSLRTSQLRLTPAETDPLARYTSAPDRPANVTAFRPSGKLSDHIPAARPGVTRSRAHSVGRPVSHLRRPGA